MIARYQKRLSGPLLGRTLAPPVAEFIKTLKDINPGLKVAYHSDGMIEPIIPELVDLTNETTLT